MSIEVISLLLLLGILAFLVLGAPLGFATGVLGAAVVYIKFGEPGLGLVMRRMYDLCTNYVLISVPLFIFMASLLERSTIAKDLYDSLNIWLRHARGGIAVVTAIMAIIMAAMSGIIGGEVVLLGLVALPQMLRLGYNQNLAIGTICASGSLGTMIPPSIVLIIYGLVTETSIHKLFIAAIAGLMLGVDPNMPDEIPLNCVICAALCRRCFWLWLCSVQLPASPQGRCETGIGFGIARWHYCRCRFGCFCRRAECADGINADG